MGHSKRMDGQTMNVNRREYGIEGREEASQTERNETQYVSHLLRLNGI